MKVEVEGEREGEGMEKVIEDKIKERLEVQEIQRKDDGEDEL